VAPALILVVGDPAPLLDEGSDSGCEKKTPAELSATQAANGHREAYDGGFKCGTRPVHLKRDRVREASKPSYVGWSRRRTPVRADSRRQEISQQTSKASGPSPAGLAVYCHSHPTSPALSFSYYPPFGIPPQGHKWGTIRRANQFAYLSGPSLVPGWRLCSSIFHRPSPAFFVLRVLHALPINTVRPGPDVSEHRGTSTGTKRRPRQGAVERALRVVSMAGLGADSRGAWVR